MDSTTAEARGQLPVSAHRAFPVIIALWCAGLLGIGSMVLPVAPLEGLVQAIGLPAIIPAAQPPLGGTARLLIALAAAALGALAGLAIARRIAARAKPAAIADAGDAVLPDTTRRPILAHEDLFDGGFDQPADPHGVPEPEPQPEPLALDAFDTLDEPTGWDSPAPAPAPLATSAPPLDRRPLESLGMVELVERFALALQRHSEASARQAAAPRPVAAAPDSGRAADYRSLLEMGQQVAPVRQPVRLASDNPAPADPRDKEATERALRAALSRLDQVSGAA